MVDLLKHFRWNYISFVYSLSFYGLHAYLLLLERLRSENICLAVEYGLPENPSKYNYRKAVERLREGSNGVSSHVAVLFLSQTSAMGILTAAKEMGVKAEFTWIASDAWGRNVQDFRGVEDVAEGTLTIKISAQNDRVFDEHFSKLTRGQTDNPFLAEFWNASCKSTEVGKCRRETTFGELHDIYKPESTVSLVKLAVYFLAHSLHEIFSRCK